MRKIIVSLHVSLDGFVAGPNGEMDWIKIDDDMFDMVNELTKEADIALYARKTYEMMEAYWPTAAQLPDATKHDIEHSNWYNQSQKVILSNTLKNVQKEKTIFVDSLHEIKKLKKEDGKNMLLFGSPSAVHLMMQHNLIDEYWLLINPIILGEGISLFTKTSYRTTLQLVSSKTFSCGVIKLNYLVKSNN